ncbi:hypothetical protein SAMN04488066_12316 [Halorubrum aquaticum]|uniref:Glycosyl hydrolase n=1 Tax=Halorubrum aquaticum TaxID=387340 RepID=A0A1I3CI62_9EURY|nr:hypothetical protein [Halorubrum aquaticum]SFH74202.1 hypothetical protein SAMN04488066_12316 [Halorubrum aquaticum]
MKVYAAYADGLRVVDPDAGRVETRLDGRRVECVAVHRDAPERVFAGTFDDGLYRSTDAGESFERVATDALGPEGAGPDAVTAIATSPHDPDTAWIGTEPSRIYRTTDGGRSVERVAGLTDVPSASEWSFPPRPDTHHVRWVEGCPADPERWYVGIEAGALLVTPDGGATWTDRPPGSRRDTHTIATHPNAPNRVYVAAGDGYAESDDRGRSFEVVDRGLDHGYVWGIAVDPGDPDRVLVSAASGANAAHSRGEAYLYRREERSDGDGNADASGWERLDDRGIPTGEGTYRAVLASGTDAGEIWALADHGLYRTTDGGGRFDRVPADLPEGTPRALAIV